MKKFLLALVIFLVLLAVLVMVFFQNNNSVGVKIGWIGALTGDAAIVGQENFNGVKVAIERINQSGGINEKPIVLIAQDDKYDPKETINAYQKLVTVDGVKFILVETYGGFLALSEQAGKDNIILVDSIDTSEEFSNLGKNVFAIGVYDESIGFSIADFLNSKKVNKVSLMVNLSDPFPLLVENAFKQKYAGEITREAYTFSTKDYRTSLSKLSENPYLVLFGWEETGRIVKQAREIGIASQIVGIDTFATENFRKNTGNNYDGLLFSFWQGSENNPEFSEFVKKYSQTYGKLPDNILFSTVGYDAAGVLASSIQKCHSEEVSCVSEKLREVKNFNGAAGSISIDSDNITRSIQETMFKYNNDEIIPVTD